MLWRPDRKIKWAINITLLDRTEVLELVRVFIFDDYGSNIESWFIGQVLNG